MNHLSFSSCLAFSFARSAPSYFQSWQATVCSAKHAVDWVLSIGQPTGHRFPQVSDQIKSENKKKQAYIGAHQITSSADPIKWRPFVVVLDFILEGGGAYIKVFHLLMTIVKVSPSVRQHM